MSQQHRVYIVVDATFEPDREEIDAFFDRFASAATFVRREEPLVAAATAADIRAQHLDGATITLLLNGRHIHAKRDADWEIHASLEPADDGQPNGLLGCTIDRSAQKFDLPPRFKDNVESGYARFYRLPLTVEELRGWLDDAAAARTGRRDLIVNERERQVADVEPTPTWSPFLDRAPA